MNSRKAHSQDELDSLVQGALEARVRAQEPPDLVWERIKLELEADQPASQPPSRVPWSPLAIQAALTLLLVVLGSIGLGTLFGPDMLRSPMRDIPSSGTIAYVDEPLASPDVIVFDDEDELRSLRADLGSRPASQADAEPDSRPPVIIARDVPPNVLFLEGPGLESELSSPVMVKEQNPIRSGPYPWYR